MLARFASHHHAAGGARAHAAGDVGPWRRRRRRRAAQEVINIMSASQHRTLPLLPSGAPGDLRQEGPRSPVRRRPSSDKVRSWFLPQNHRNALLVLLHHFLTTGKPLSRWTFTSTAAAMSRGLHCNPQALSKVFSAKYKDLF